MGLDTLSVWENKGMCRARSKNQNFPKTRCDSWSICVMFLCESLGSKLIETFSPYKILNEDVCGSPRRSLRDLGRTGQDFSNKVYLSKIETIGYAPTRIYICLHTSIQGKRIKSALKPMSKCSSHVEVSRMF